MSCCSLLGEGVIRDARPARVTREPSRGRPATIGGAAGGGRALHMSGVSARVEMDGPPVMPRGPRAVLQRRAQSVRRGGDGPRSCSVTRPAARRPAARSRSAAWLRRRVGAADGRSRRDAEAGGRPCAGHTPAAHVAARVRGAAPAGRAHRAPCAGLPRRTGRSPSPAAGAIAAPAGRPRRTSAAPAPRPRISAARPRALDRRARPALRPVVSN